MCRDMQINFREKPIEFWKSFRVGRRGRARELLDDGLADFIEDGIGFDPLLVDSDGNGTPDGQDLIEFVLLCVTPPTPAVPPVGIRVLIVLIAGLGISRSRRRGTRSP